jgi:replication factor A1
MGAIEEVYEDLDADLSEEEFRSAVEEKVAQMGGLADEETAAMLVAHEFEDEDVETVADIEPGMEDAEFRAKVISVGEIRTFERDDDEESEGRVVNVQAGDESGRVRLTFWDDHAQAVTDGEIESGDVLKVAGRPKEGYDGVEVNVSQAEIDADADIEVATDETTIDDLVPGMSDVTVRGLVLDTEQVRTFDRDDGSEGRVANLVLGDETGRVRVTLWDSRADSAERLSAGESVEIMDGYVRERDDETELHVGDRGAVEAIDEQIEYNPDTTPIDAVELEQTVDLQGVVRSSDPKRTFDRDDGSEGQVKNIRIQDDSGDIRVALWGEKADRDVAPGDEVIVTGAEIQDGYQDDLEASAGWGATLTVLGDTTDPERAESGDGRDEAGLSAFAGDAEPDGGAAAATGDDSVTAATPESPDADDGEPVDVTGVVIQDGDPVILDIDDGAVPVETTDSVTLGETVRVIGQRYDDHIAAAELQPADRQ